jgi:hypothetical protein
LQAENALIEAFLHSCYAIICNCSTRKIFILQSNLNSATLSACNRQFVVRTEERVKMPEPNTTWSPAVTIDLDTCSALAFQELVTRFDEWSATQLPPTELPVTTGWCTITPEIAEKLLRRNKVNRKLSLSAIRKYAACMIADMWIKTGQAILITTDGQVWDAQHRLWACYMSGVTFETYVVCDIPVHDSLFAFIDDSKPRNAADALYTAGANGMAASVAGAIKLAWRYDHNALVVTNKQPVIRPFTNIEVLNYSRQHPEVGAAAHHVSANYPTAVKVIGNKPAAIFSASKILTLYGNDVLEDFFRPLGSGANLDEHDPILHLRNKLLSTQENDMDLKYGPRLALLIKAFNLFKQDKGIGRNGLFLRTDERFPRFIEPAELAEAAQ